MMRTGPTTREEAHITRFDGDAATRWAPDGPARWLHRYNRIRIPYIRDAACSSFERSCDDGDALRGLRFLDIGCGVGILCEPLAQLGASVLGIDPAIAPIELARSRAERSGLDLSYRIATAETLAEEGEQFDVVLAMEVIEHVADYRLFLKPAPG